MTAPEQTTRWRKVPRDLAAGIVLSLLATILFATLFAVYSQAPMAGGATGEHLAAAAGLVFGACLLTACGVHFTYRKAVRALREHLASLREKPSSPLPPSL